MVKSRLIRATAVAAASAGLIVGFTGLAGASSGSITGPTGPDSTNKVIGKSSLNIKIHNHNDLSLGNSNSQSAWTGSASVKHNTTGGDATSGDAANDNVTALNVHVTNSMPDLQGVADCGCNGGGDITGPTGPDSLNLVVSKSSVKVDVNNTNNVSLDNSSSQTAKSGKASVSGNTTGGDATSGAASNSNATTLSVTLSN